MQGVKEKVKPDLTVPKSPAFALKGRVRPAKPVIEVWLANSYRG